MLSIYHGVFFTKPENLSTVFKISNMFEYMKENIKHIPQTGEPDDIYYVLP